MAKTLATSIMEQELLHGAQVQKKCFEALARFARKTLSRIDLIYRFGIYTDNFKGVLVQLGIFTTVSIYGSSRTSCARSTITILIYSVYYELSCNKHTGILKFSGP